MGAGLELDAVERARARGVEVGLLKLKAAERVPRFRRIANIIACTFDEGQDAFRVHYADSTSCDLPRDRLGEVGERRVVAWAIDQFRRGVDVLLDDASMTSFSAEFPIYIQDGPSVSDRQADRGLAQRVARRVVEWRESRGWSVAELARRLDMAAPNVHRIEVGAHKPLPTTLVRLAAAFEVPLAQLVGVNDDST